MWIFQVVSYDARSVLKDTATLSILQPMTGIYIYIAPRYKIGFMPNAADQHAGKWLSSKQVKGLIDKVTIYVGGKRYSYMKPLQTRKKGRILPAETIWNILKQRVKRRDYSLIGLDERII